MSNRGEWENKAREYYRRHHLSDEPGEGDVKALGAELYNAFVAGAQADHFELIKLREAARTHCEECRDAASADSLIVLEAFIDAATD